MSILYRRARRILIMKIVIVLVPMVILATPCHAVSSCANGYVALTFDDGPNETNTPALLDALRSAGLRATMFNVGRDVERYPEIARAEHEAGMWIGNHSWSHPRMTDLDEDQMEWELHQTQAVVKRVTGQTPRVFRAPYVDINDTLRSVAARLGLMVIPMGVDSGDWRGANTTQVVEAARSLEPGDVMVMHDRKRDTVDAIPRIASVLEEKELCTGAISTETGRAAPPDGEWASSAT